MIENSAELAKSLLLGEEIEFIKCKLIEAIKSLNCDYGKYKVTYKVIECLDKLSEKLPAVTGSCDVNETGSGFEITLFKYYYEKDWELATIKITHDEIHNYICKEN